MPTAALRTADTASDPALLAIAAKCCIDAARFGWYDSHFLAQFEAAKRFLAHVRPDRLTEFTRAFDILRTDPGFTLRHIDGLFSADTFATIVEAVRTMPPAALLEDEANLFGRSLARRHPLFNALQDGLIDRVSDMAGERVVPAYNFLSLYRGMGRCDPHLDDPSAKWTLDICIEQSVEWPIWFSQVIDWPERAPAGGYSIDTLRRDAALTFEPAVLTPNNAVLFSGTSQWHYREPLTGSTDHFCHLLFLHYVPEHAGELPYPAKWAAHFDMPELDVLVRAFTLVTRGST
jgi:hypothetical protein